MATSGELALGRAMASNGAVSGLAGFAGPEPFGWARAGAAASRVSRSPAASLRSVMVRTSLGALGALGGRGRLLVGQGHDGLVRGPERVAGDPLHVRRGHRL